MHLSFWEPRTVVYFNTGSWMKWWELLDSDSEKNKNPLISIEYWQCALVTSEKFLLLGLTVLEFQAQHCVTNECEENKTGDLHYSTKILRQLVSDSDPNLQRKLGWQCGLGVLLLMIAYLIFNFLLFYFPQSS